MNHIMHLIRNDVTTCDSSIWNFDEKRCASSAIHRTWSPRRCVQKDIVLGVRHRGWMSVLVGTLILYQKMCFKVSDINNVWGSLASKKVFSESSSTHIVIAIVFFIMNLLFVFLIYKILFFSSKSRRKHNY